MAKSICAPDDHSHLSLLNIQFKVLELYNALIITFTLFGSLSARFSSVSVGICAYTVTQALMRPDTESVF